MKAPTPVFDDLNHIDQCDIGKCILDKKYGDDFLQALNFLKSYKGSLGTFVSYRRDVERLLHWCTLIANKSLKELKRQDIEEFIHFCQKPPKSWIGVHKVPRFIDENGFRIPNPKWRPFVVTVSKALHQTGERPNPKDFEFSHTAAKDMFSILGICNSFVRYCVGTTYNLFSTYRIPSLQLVTYPLVKLLLYIGIYNRFNRVFLFSRLCT